MWQELLVALFIIAALLLILSRVRRVVKKADDLAECCAKDCTSCGNTEMQMQRKNS